MAGPAADADPGDQGQDDVLGADSRSQPPVDPDLVGPRPALEQALGRQDHLDLARADPEGQRAERAVGGGVRVAAHDRHSRLGQAELRPDDVDDPLVGRAQAVERDPELGAVVGQLLDLGGRDEVGDRQGPIVGRDRMVGGRHGLARPADRQPALAQAGEGLRAGHLVDEVQVDPQDARGAGLVVDHVLIPDLVDQGARGGGDGRHARRLAQGPGRHRAGLEAPDDRPRTAVPSGWSGGLRNQRTARTLRGPGACRARKCHGVDTWVSWIASSVATSPSSSPVTAGG